MYNIECLASCFFKMKIPDTSDTGIMENDSLILCVVLFLEKIFCIIKKLSF